MSDKEFTQALGAICGRFLRTDVDLKPYSYLKTGGVARHFVHISDTIVAEEEGEENLPDKTLNRLRSIVDFLVREGKPYRVLGRGSNIIIKDGWVETVVLHLQFDKIPLWVKASESPHDHNKRLLQLPAPLPLIRALKIAYDFHLQGLEFVIGIPGTVGGAVVMNAGVKQHEIKDILVNATVLRENTIEIADRESLGMGYRQSNITENDIVLQAEFELTQVSFKEVQELKKKNMKDIEERKRTQPLEYPSVGSTFKNPLPEYAGALIERCGLKDFHYGGIRISPLHANFIINEGKGTSAEALHLIQHIRQTVHSRTGILLELEVRKFGF